jgi:hypothetical protein
MKHMLSHLWTIPTEYVPLIPILSFFFIMALCILISSKSFIYQQMHFLSALENIKIYIKTAPTCFDLRPSSGSFYRFNKYDFS